MPDLHEAYEAVFDKDALIAELRDALDYIRNYWAGHSETCEVALQKRNGKCDCDWPLVRNQCDAALAQADAYLKAKSHG